MSDQHITFSPERNQWTLADGRHHMEVPEWTREIMRDEFERETRSLRNENDRLRELVRDVNKAAHMLCEAWEGSCSKEAEGMSLHAVCPISDTNELCVFGKLYDRLRELGVEVDG